ncbi:MAG: hypothetical protein WBA07_30080 [Rivularia sp. (in: cyanobacteria)]
MNYCPCCTDILLNHADASGNYWFCRSCRQAMPVCTCKQSVSLTQTIAGEFPTLLNPRKKANYLLSSRRKNMVNYRQPLAS